MGLRHLRERLALQLLAKLIHADAQRLRRRVEPAAHTLLIATAGATTLAMALAVRAATRSVIAAIRAATRAAIWHAHIGAGLVHRLLELIGRDPESGSERGEELLMLLSVARLLLAGLLFNGGLARRGWRLLRRDDAETGADQGEGGHTRHSGSLD